MHLKQKLASLAVAAVALMATVPAFAGGSASFSVTNNIAGTGQWNVSVVEVGNTGVWDLTVIAGTPHPFAVGHSVSMTLFSGAPLTSTALTGVAGTGQTSPGSIWNTTGALTTTAIWHVPGNTTAPTAIATNGSNVFKASFALSPNVQAQSVAVSVQDGGTSLVWFGTASVVPEGSALALLLPGLIPVGIALRRRRASKAVPN